MRVFSCGHPWLVGPTRVLSITLEADSFLYQMARIIVGTLLEVGAKRREPEDMARILEAQDRRRAGRTAPPQGLYLWDVKY
ncbi:MAG: hypothetical protein HYU64_04100 [Armatimonadetes bacterium]|nr:hypothetical protein [Armatimonadota bacterium]